MILTGNKPKKARSGIACTLIRFSLPLIFSGILQQLYNWADAFIVGNVEGELALAAIGATGTVVNFYLMAITGFTIGLAILFAQNLAAVKTQLSRKYSRPSQFCSGSALSCWPRWELGLPPLCCA